MNWQEREIDRLVYQLYELTDDEIAIVEAGAKRSGVLCSNSTGVFFMATNRLEAILAQARQLSPAELSQLIKTAADLLAQSTQNKAQPVLSYAALFGSGKGAFSSVEETDRFLRGERDAWDE